MSAGTMERALERTARNLFEGRSAEAALAAREAGTADPALEAAAVEELRKAQDPDGSWGGDLVRTAESLLLLNELGGPAAESAASAGVAWLRTRQDAPGRFGDGCDEARHALGLCHHFTSGFFAAAASDVPITGITLGSGARIEGDLPARLAASCLALQAMLVRGGGGSAVALHLDALYRIVLRRTAWQDPVFPPSAFLTVVGTLLHAPESDDAEAVLDLALELITRAQRADGTWPEADTFQATELLLAVVRTGRSQPGIDAALRRVARLLASSQQRDGGWGRESGPRRTYAAWRAMRYSLDESEGAGVRSAAGVNGRTSSSVS